MRVGATSLPPPPRSLLSSISLPCWRLRMLMVTVVLDRRAEARSGGWGWGSEGGEGGGGRETSSLSLDFFFIRVARGKPLLLLIKIFIITILKLRALVLLSTQSYKPFNRLLYLPIRRMDSEGQSPFGLSMLGFGFTIQLKTSKLSHLSPSRHASDATGRTATTAALAISAQYRKWRRGFQRNRFTHQSIPALLIFCPLA